MDTGEPFKLTVLPVNIYLRAFYQVKHFLFFFRNSNFFHIQQEYIKENSTSSFTPTNKIMLLPMSVNLKEISFKALESG